MKNSIMTYIILFLINSSFSFGGKVSEKWRNTITYEIFVQSFCDSNGDGIGDIKGMTSKLDYIAGLGAKAIWLMPINPSPSYHKYDVTDYYGIHPDYGTLEDFREFVAESHKRDIKVIIDLVINHSSRQHPWFQEALKDKNSKYFNYYVWMNPDDIQKSNFKIEVGPDTDNRRKWNSVDNYPEQYFTHFGGGMPDLNYDNPELRDEVFKIGRFWLEDVNVDGFRLDAAKHIYPDYRKEDNYAWWKDFYTEMKKSKEDVYLVGEVWSDYKSAAPYLQGLSTVFNFELSGKILDALKNEDTKGLVSAYSRIEEIYKSIDPEYIDATFLTNHDIKRTASVLKNSREKIKLAASLLLTMPGSPYIYYGEELGLPGEKPDLHIREPFLWDIKDNDKCRTKWMEPKYNISVDPLTIQAKDKSSVYNHYLALIAVRNANPVLFYGGIQEIMTEEDELCVFLRSNENDDLLVIHNVSEDQSEWIIPSDYSSFKNTIFSSHSEMIQDNGKIILPPYSTIVLSDR